MVKIIFLIRGCVTTASLRNCQVNTILAQLNYFRKNSKGKREGTIWFCLNRSLVFTHGTKSFFKFYGGEAIYFWNQKDNILGELCKKIGYPVIVEALIDTSELKIFRQYGFDRTLISSYANTINNNFRIDHLEGYVNTNIPSDKIIKVHNLEDFTNKYTSCA